MNTKHRPMKPIDRTKHDEDIAERMIGGIRMDRVSHVETREREQRADDDSRVNRLPSERRQHR